MHETQSRLAARRVCVLWLLLFLLLLFVFAAFVVVLFCLFVVLLGVGEGVQADLEQQFNGVEGLLAVPRRRKSARLGGQQRVNELAVVHLEMLWWCCCFGGVAHTAHQHCQKLRAARDTQMHAQNSLGAMKD